MKTLYLNISREPFEVMETGEKKNEYRKPTNWIISRLFDKKTGKRKQYDLISITWGYGERPFFIAKFKGFYISERNFTMTYSTGFKVEIEKGDYILKFGKILKHYKDSNINLFCHD